MSNLQKALDKLGYPLVLNARTRRVPGGVRSGGYSIDGGHNEDGEEAFVIDTIPSVEILVLDTKPEEEAALILIRDRDAPHGDKNLAKMLIGHDERQLFVAAVPTNTKTVADAKDKLKPGRVHAVEQRAGVKKKDKNKHRNKARIRQGDWFFVPVTDPSFLDMRLIQKNQPLRRGTRGNAHSQLDDREADASSSSVLYTEEKRDSHKGILMHALAFHGYGAVSRNSTKEPRITIYMWTT